MSASIIAFYAGAQPDHAGRFVSEIQTWPDDELESVHDFIQWLFPLPEPSPVNPLAPVLDRETIAAFASRPELRAVLHRSFERMLRFYGFVLRDGAALVIEPGPHFPEAARNWLTPGNHNHLRITRILRSVRLLGLPAESEAFLQALREIRQTPRGQRGITETTFRFWEATAG